MPPESDSEQEIEKQLIQDAALLILGAIIEHNSKINQTNEISNRIKNYVNDMGTKITNYLDKHSLNQYKGKIDWYHQEYSEIIINSIENIDSVDKTSEKLNELINKIGEVVNEISNVFNENMDFYSEHAHTVLVDAVTLQMTAYSELSQRCGIYTSQLFILNSMEFLLKNIKKRYEYKYEKSKQQHTNNYMDYSLHKDFQTYKSMIKDRKDYEHKRYIQWLNLNSKFQFKATDEAPKFGNFDFKRCPNYSIKEVENTLGALAIDKISVLAINNNSGSLDDPSIFKDVYDIPAESLCTITVMLKSTSANRPVKLYIYELLNGEHYSHFIEETTLNETWQEKTITYKKQRNDTFLRLEIYWFDKFENDILIYNPFINFTQVEPSVPPVVYSNILPYPDYLSLRNRSTNRSLYFSTDANYSSSLYYAANDSNKMYDSPSAYFDLIIMWSPDWARLNVSFEAYLKTRENIEREIQLCIHELYPLGAGNYEIKNSVWSQKFKLTDEWQFFTLTCNRQHHTHVRCEIYWNDNNGVDIMLRDIKAYFTVK